MKQYIVIIILLIGNLNLLAQGHLDIDTLSLECYNLISRKTTKTYVITIKNNSHEAYYTWLSPTSITKEDTTKIIHDFFRRRYGDFNFLECLNEGILNDNSNKTKFYLGFTFLKKIYPKDIFSYIIVGGHKTLNLYKDKIAVVEEEKIRSYLKDIELKDEILFPYQSVYLSK